MSIFGMASDQKKKKCIQYSVEYLQYGIVQAPQSQQQPMCLLCENTFSNEAMKPSRLLDHFNKIHPDKKDNGLAYFQSLRDRMQKQKTVTSVFSNSSKQVIDGLRASYHISLLIAQSGKPHTIRKTLIPVISQVLRTVLHKPPEQVVKIDPTQ